MRRGLAALLLVLGVAGCGGSGSHPAPPAATQPGAAPPASVSAAPLAGVTAGDSAPAHATAATCTAGQVRRVTTRRAATILYLT